MYSNSNRYLPRRRCLSRGYTLIEVLVAVSIFTAMLMLAGMALNQGLIQYHGLVEKGLDFWDYAKKIWIDKSFNSATDYYIYTRSDGWFPYFKGNQDDISYVSLAPFAGQLPVVVWIKKETESGGKSSLVYYEIPVYTKTGEEIERDYVFDTYKKGQSFKVLEGVESITFSFYGYDVTRRAYQWYNSFDGNKMKVLPSLVKISYSRDTNRGNLVFSINTNSMIKKSYNDAYQK